MKSHNKIFTQTGCIRKEILLAYKDDMLGRKEKHEVEEHLIDCHLCTEALEGLALVSGTEVLDELNHELRNKLSGQVPGIHSRPRQKFWYAAAGIGSLVLLSYVAFKQFREANNERVAINQTAIDKDEIAPPVVSAIQTEDSVINKDTIVESATGISAAPQTNLMQSNQIVNQSDTTVTEFKVAQEEVTEMAAPDEVMSVKSEAVQGMPSTSEGYNVNNVTPVFSNTVTYVQNRKIVDYSENLSNAEPAVAKDAGVPPAYQNKEKMLESKKNEISISKKVSYTGLIEDPIILFNNRKYDSAIREFNNVLKVNPEDMNAKFYSGLSNYHLQKYPVAIDLLSPFTNDISNPFYEEARFYLAKSWVDSGKKDDGRKLLKTIAEEKGFYSKHAEEELEKIRE
jgi:TolA-binding protein